MRQRLLRSIVLLAGALGLGGCLELGLARAIAFPPDIAGLDRAQPWVRLPVDVWVTEGGITPVAVAGCFAASCAPPAAVGLFRAQGLDAERLARISEDPDGVARALSETKEERPPAGRPVPPVTASARRIAEGGWRGVLLHMARRDGTRGIYGSVLSRSSAGEITTVMVITATEEAALRIARGIVQNVD